MSTVRPEPNRRATGSAVIAAATEPAARTAAMPTTATSGACTPAPMAGQEAPSSASGRPMARNPRMTCSETPGVPVRTMPPMYLFVCHGAHRKTACAGLPTRARPVRTTTHWRRIPAQCAAESVTESDLAWVLARSHSCITMRAAENRSRNHGSNANVVAWAITPKSGGTSIVPM